MAYFGKDRNLSESEGVTMAKYVLAYTGGGGMAQTEEEQKAVMDAWGAWFGSMGEAVTDWGAPFGASATIASDGAVSNAGRSGLSGYSVLQADSLDAALGMAKGCPVLSSGGSVEVYEGIGM